VGYKWSKKWRGGKSIGVSRVAKGARVTKPKMGGAKGKLTFDYDSEDFLSSNSNDSTPKTTMVKSRSDSMGKHSIKELLKTIHEKDKEIRS
jgi:hypothetical protein